MIAMLRGGPYDGHEVVLGRLRPPEIDCDGETYVRTGEVKRPPGLFKGRYFRARVYNHETLR